MGAAAFWERLKPADGREQKGQEGPVGAWIAQLKKGLAAIAAETGRPPIGLAAIKARRFEPRPAFIAEKRLVTVLSLTLGTNYGHDAARR